MKRKEKKTKQKREKREEGRKEGSEGGKEGQRREGKKNGKEKKIATICSLSKRLKKAVQSVKFWWKIKKITNFLVHIQLLVQGTNLLIKGH